MGGTGPFQRVGTEGGFRLTTDAEWFEGDRSTRLLGLTISVRAANHRSNSFLR